MGKATCSLRWGLGPYFGLFSVLFTGLGVKGGGSGALGSKSFYHLQLPMTHTWCRVGAQPMPRPPGHGDLDMKPLSSC